MLVLCRAAGAQLRWQAAACGRGSSRSVPYASLGAPGAGISHASDAFDPASLDPYLAGYDSGGQGRGGCKTMGMW